jgi:hypothetical protein
VHLIFFVLFQLGSRVIFAHLRLGFFLLLLWLDGVLEKLTILGSLFLADGAVIYFGGEATGSYFFASPINLGCVNIVIFIISLLSAGVLGLGADVIQ